MSVSSDLLADLDASDRKALREAMGREPNATEAHLAAVMWSEHTSYRHSKATLRRFRADGARVAVGIGENAGVLDVGGGFLVALRIESHNHPSAVEPLQGAATGLGGILRDVLACGARPIAFLDGLFLAPPGEARGDFLARGIVSGVAHYGNSVGVATPGGHTTFDEAYRSSPLLNAMCIGLVAKDDLIRGSFQKAGDLLVLIGSPTGRDGLAGAAFASRTTAAGDEARPEVQIADPFMGKLLTEAVLELASRGLIRALGDLGAAGITSAASELAHRGHLGVSLDLDAVPLREAGMAAHEILLSETQERMLAEIRPENAERVQSTCRHYGVGAAVIGRVTGEGRFRCLKGGEEVVAMAASTLAAGAPPRDLARPDRPSSPETGDPLAFDEAARRFLEGRGSGSLGEIWERYDDRVGLRTVLGPGRDALLLRLPEAGITLAATMDARPGLVRRDARRGAVETVLEALRNLAAVGARPIGIVDCLNFGDPDLPQVGEAFRAVVDGVASTAQALDIPVVGGNVSFYNGSENAPLPPTPVIGAVGLLDDGLDPATVRDESPGSRIFLLGPWESLSATPFRLPDADLALEARTLDLVVEL